MDHVMDEIKEELANARESLRKARNEMQKNDWVEKARRVSHESVDAYWEAIADLDGMLSRITHDMDEYADNRWDQAKTRLAVIVEDLEEINEKAARRRKRISEAIGEDVEESMDRVEESVRNLIGKIRD